jgi:hypothetical protein
MAASTTTTGSIMSSSWDYWNEPNDSQGRPRRTQPDRAHHFCLVGTYGSHYKLYRHCHK